MNYYKFHIGDYKSHTSHLSLIEDLAYRRLLDWIYLHEKPIPTDIKSISRAIGMRDHQDCVADILEEFFDKTDDGFTSKRAMEEIAAYKRMSEGGKRGAKTRWNEEKDGVAIGGLKGGHKGVKQPLIATNNHKPITNNQVKGFTPPTHTEVSDYCRERGNNIDAQRFCDFYQSKGWMVGKNKMKDWKAAVRQWESRDQSRSVEADPFAGGI